MNTRKLALSALGFALIFVFTMLKINVAVVGYVHIGDAAILLMSSILPPFLSAVVAGASSALVDVVSGYGNYAIATFIIKALFACCASLMLRKNNIKMIPLLIVVWIIVVGGYSLWDYIQFQTGYYALISIGANTVQVVVSFVVFAFLYKKLGPYIQKKKL